MGGARRRAWRSSPAGSSCVRTTAWAASSCPFGDRLFDGCVLGALAWVSRTADPWLAAGALLALAAGFLASYIRARGGSLGYGIEEGVVTPAIRYGLVSAGADRRVDDGRCGRWPS